MLISGVVHASTDGLFFIQFWIIGNVTSASFILDICIHFLSPPPPFTLNSGTRYNVH